MTEAEELELLELENEEAQVSVTPKPLTFGQKVGKTALAVGRPALSLLDWINHLGQPKAAKALIERTASKPDVDISGLPIQAQIGAGMGPVAYSPAAQAMALDIATSPMSYTPLIGQLSKIPMIGKLLQGLKAGTKSGVLKMLSGMTGAKPEALVKGSTGMGRKVLANTMAGSQSAGERLSSFVINLTKDMPEAAIADEASKGMEYIDKAGVLSELEDLRKPMRGSNLDYPRNFNNELDNVKAQLGGKTEAELTERAVKPEIAPATPVTPMAAKKVNAELPPGYISAGEYVMNSLRGKGGIKKTGSTLSQDRNTLNIHPDDMGKFGLTIPGTEGQTLSKAAMARELGGFRVNPTREASRMDALTHAFAEERYGVGKIPEMRGETVYDLPDIDTEYGPHSDDMVAAFKDLGHGNAGRAKVKADFTERIRQQEMGGTAQDLEQAVGHEKAVQAGKANAKYGEYGPPGEPPQVVPDRLLSPMWTSQDARGVMQDLVEGIDYNAPNAKAAIEIRKAARGIIRKHQMENAINSGKPEYIDAIEKMHKKFDAAEEMKRLIGETEGVTQDQKAQNLVNSLYAKGQEYAPKQVSVKNFDQLAGTDFSTEAKDLSLAKQFKTESGKPGWAPVSEGGKRFVERAPIVGGAVGGLLGALKSHSLAGEGVGAGIGAVLGTGLSATTSPILATRALQAAPIIENLLKGAAKAAPAGVTGVDIFRGAANPAPIESEQSPGPMIPPGQITPPRPQQLIPLRSIGGGGMGDLRDYESRNPLPRNLIPIFALMQRLKMQEQEAQ